MRVLTHILKMSIIKCQMGEGHFIGDDKKRIHHLHQFVLQIHRKTARIYRKIAIAEETLFRPVMTYGKV